LPDLPRGLAGRGELDKIIERSGAAPAPQPSAAPAPSPYSQQPQAGHGYHGKPYKRRKSFLEELFD
jgi:uncharacterized protein